jgi:hypothetical protein
MRRSVARAVVGSGGGLGGYQPWLVPTEPPWTWNRLGTPLVGANLGWHKQGEAFTPSGVQRRTDRANQGWHPPNRHGHGTATEPPLVGANLGWHKQGEAVIPSGVQAPDGSCQPRLAPTNSRSSACLWWVRTVGPHSLSDTSAPAGAPPLWHCADQRSAPTDGRSPQQQVSSALPRLPGCSASTWPRSSGPRHPAPG